MESKQALLLIDIQNDYFDGGNFPLVGSFEASLNAKRILELFRERKWPVFHIQHIAANPDATFFRPHSPGVEIHENVCPIEGETVVEKHYPNCFRATGLLDLLWSKEVKEIVVCGMMTHMCVEAAVRAGKDLGLNCAVIADACATKDMEIFDKNVTAPNVHAASLAAMSFFYATITTTGEFLEKMA